MSREDKIKQFKALVDAFHDDLEEGRTVYHYTSAEGFSGIIERGELWLTNTAFVNDTTECRALWELTDLFAEDDLRNEFVWKRWDSRLRSHADASDGGNTPTLYIASFSEKGDSLEQWRAYGGFCIGFDVTKMARKGFRWHKCVYTRHGIREWILHKSGLGEWDGHSLEDRQKFMAAGELLAVASTKYKSRYYEGEKELRLAAISNHTWKPYSSSPGMFAKEPPIHFRDHPAYKIPVPYVKFFVPSSEMQANWCEEVRRETPVQLKRRRLEEEDAAGRDLLPITEILIGPMARREEAKLACEIMLREKGYEHVRIQVPDVPYRGV